MDFEGIKQLLAEYEIKFIRLAFCDISGRQKNIAIMADELEHAVEHGVSFDASAIRGFLNISESDLLLFPDLDTFSILPWRPSDRAVARFYCYITYPDRRPFEGDGRYLLSEIEKSSRSAGYSFLVGPECEFYLFETDEKGYPTLNPFDEAGYFDMAPLDRGENVRREICFALENMGIKPERSHHEHGPGQNEVDFRCSSPLKAADDLMTFKTAVKAIAQLHGLYASFMPKPIENESGNGLHINLSLYENGENLFEKEEAKAMSFMAGILRRMKEITVFSNPLVSSYERFGQFEAPSTVSWSHQNRSTLVRIPYAEGSESRMEVRSPDPAANPYLLISLLLSAGFEGIAERQVAFAEATGDMLSSPLSERLPKNLSEAVEEARRSEFIRSVIPERIVSTFLSDRAEDAEECEKEGRSHEALLRRYFRFI
ncbi:MAG: glutamine synthetase [Spirochaetes bacterium]|uniref:Glutamine synthetase n=1 Tax=Candidatus Ornithospirochaeta stercoripullorum TaxID=2840899 RepID=A0A9D9E1Y9_9SPIO|nr:glutamine synthetase [Candidatus Ornithospirochaeta stercoripullorum]